MTKPIFNYVSKTWAKGTTGSADAFLNIKLLRSSSTFLKTEGPILEKKAVELMFHTR